MAEDIQNKFDTVIFKKKTLGMLMEEVYSKSNNNEKMIINLVEQLKDLLGDGASIGDALTIAPLIAAYMKLNLDTNEQLIKMLNIVQKCLEKPKDKDADGKDTLQLSEEDRKALEQLQLEYEQQKVPASIPASINELKPIKKQLV